MGVLRSIGDRIADLLIDAAASVAVALVRAALALSLFFFLLLGGLLRLSDPWTH